MNKEKIMKFPKNLHDHSLAGNLFKHVPDTLREYVHRMYRSSKCKNMTQGACDILRMMTRAHGDNWRRNHPKNLKKQHK